MLKATTAYCYEEVRNYGKILFIQNIVENGWRGDALAAYPTSPPGCLITKDDLKLKRYVLNYKYPRQLSHDGSKEVKGILSGGTGKTILKC